MMGPLSPWQWLIVLILVALVIYPVAVILRKAGRSLWWAVLAVIPGVNLVALWAFAFTSWPRLDRQA